MLSPSYSQFLIIHNTFRPCHHVMTPKRRAMKKSTSSYP